MAVPTRGACLIRLLLLCAAICAAVPAWADAPWQADWLLIVKSERRLTLFTGVEPRRSYRIALGANPEGPKRHEGDNRTPEGVYVIDARKVDSDYHRALRISYPNEEDRARAAAAGVDPGGQIMIHGVGTAFGTDEEYHVYFDWTNGCIAVTDEEMDEIWRFVGIGTPVVIRP